MKTLILALLISSSASAFEFYAGYSNQGDRTIEIACENVEDTLCQNACGNEFSCSLVEPICASCLGTSDLLIRDLFQNMGKRYVSEHEVLDMITLGKLIASRQFIILSSDSAFNYLDSFNSQVIRERFQKMCPLPEQIPYVVVETEVFTNRPQRAAFTLCFDEFELLTQVFTIKHVTKIFK